MLLNLLKDKKKFFEKIKFSPFLMQYPCPDYWKKDFSKMDFLDNVLNLNIKSLNLYIHIPFCDYLCSYCSFSKILTNHDSINNYLDKLEQEFDFWDKLLDLSNIEIKTIFIGGGTPTTLNKSQIQKLGSIFQKYYIKTNGEFTIETNPDRIDENFIYWKQLGVNRVSIGQQTFSENILKKQNRNYISYDKFKSSVQLLRKIGFENINIDMIYGFENFNSEYRQILEDDLNKILQLNPEHISFYPLILYYKKLSNLQLADFFEDLEKQYEFISLKLGKAYDFYTLEYVKKKNTNHYHFYQVNYLKGENVLGLGPSGFSFLENIWFKNYFYLKDYLQTKFFPEYAFFIKDKEIDLKRKFVMGIRLNQVEKQVVENLLNLSLLEQDVIDELFYLKNEKYILKKDYQKYQDLLLYYFNQKWIIN